MENEYMWKQAVDYAKSEYEHDYGDWDSLEKYEKEDIIFHEYFKLKDSVIIDSDGNECNTGDCVRFILKEDSTNKEQIARLCWWVDEYGDGSGVFCFDQLDENGEPDEIFWEEDIKEFHLIKQED